jgi:hypothetical protein
MNSFEKWGYGDVRYWKNNSTNPIDKLVKINIFVILLNDKFRIKTQKYGMKRNDHDGRKKPANIINIYKKIASNTGFFCMVMILKNKPANTIAMAKKRPSTLLVGKYNQSGQKVIKVNNNIKSCLLFGFVRYMKTNRAIDKNM